LQGPRSDEKAGSIGLQGKEKGILGKEGGKKESALTMQYEKGYLPTPQKKRKKRGFLWLRTGEGKRRKEKTQPPSERNEGVLSGTALSNLLRGGEKKRHHSHPL